MRCLKRRPQERWPSVANLAGALAPFGPEHTSDALSRIYEFLPPTHPQHVVPDDSADDEQVSGAPPGQTEAEETLYLRKAEARGGISGWWSAALAMATFGLGAGLGWVMTLDTDPTAPGGVRPYPAAVVPPKPQPADPQPSKIQPGEDQPALDSAANAAAHNSIDLDDEPAVAPPVAAPPAALAPAPTIAAVPTPVQPMPKPAVAPAPAQPPPAQPPPAQPPPAQAPPPPAAPPPPPPQAPDARDVEF